MHHGAAVEHSLRIGAAGGIRVGHPDGKVVLAVELLRHALQVPQIDAVAVLQHPVVVVSKRSLKYGADADGLPAAAPIHTTSWLPHWISTL